MSKFKYIKDRDQRLSSIAKVFGEPELQTEVGDWHQIDTSEKADLAQCLNQTAVGYFWHKTQAENASNGLVSGHEWHVLADADGKIQVALVSLCHELPNTMPKSMIDEHVTGFMNAPVSEIYRPAIQMLNETRNLNLFGRQPPTQEPDPGPAPS